MQPQTDNGQRHTERAQPRDTGTHAASAKGTTHMGLDLHGRTVLAVDHDYTVRIKLTGDVFICIESPLHLVNPTGQHLTLTPDEDPSEAFGPVAELVGKTIATATADTSGTLRVAFGGGARIVVEPDAQYESWNVSRPDGSLIVSTPGGRLARWSPTPPDRAP